jgi:hypothetical protein
MILERKVPNAQSFTAPALVLDTATAQLNRRVVRPRQRTNDDRARLA